jgi:ABC-type amino acid transport substrate-binding protein
MKNRNHFVSSAFSSLINRREFIRLSGALALGATVMPARAATPKLETVEPGFLTVAMTGDLPLSEGHDGKVGGMEGNLISALAARLGLTPKPAVMEWVATIESIRSGRADVMIGNLGWTAKRSEVIAMTDPVYYVTRGVVQRSSSQIDSVEAMSGKRIGTVQGFTFIQDMRRVPGIAEFKLYDSPDACVRDIIAGRLDAASLDAPMLDNLIRQNPSWGLIQRPIKPNPAFPFLTGRNQATWGMRMENCALFTAMNQGLAWASRTGLTRKCIAEYLPADAYLAPIPNHQRIGVDRDAQGHVIGNMAKCAQEAQGGSGYFS